MMKSIVNRGEIPGKTHLKSLGKIEAIASGVQARIEKTMGYSKRVTDETVNIARSLGIPNSEIERWVTYRLNRLSRDTEKIRGIKSRLHRVYPGLKI